MSNVRAERSMKRSAHSALVVMLATLASRLLGFVKMAVIGALFGAGARADVLHLVFVIPNNLRKLLAEGALSSAFIPVLSERIVKDPDGHSASHLVERLLTFQALILLPLISLSIAFAPQVVNVILDFRIPEQQQTAVELFRFIMPYLFFISVAAVVVGTLNSHERFFIPAIAPLAFSVAVIASLIAFHRRLDVFAMAAGVLAGGVLQLSILLPLFFRLGYRIRPRRVRDDAHMKRVISQWLPVVATASIYTINQQVAMRFASGLEPGSGSAMQNALVFWQLPFGLFSASITTVLFPRMSRQIASDDNEGVRDTLETGFRYLIGLMIPAAVFLALYGVQTIAVALQSGAFTTANSVLAGRVLAAYSIGLLSVGAFNYFQRFFYARSDYRTPLYTAAIVLVIDVALSLWLKETPLRVVGLAVAHSVAFTIGLLILLFRASAVAGRFNFRAIFSTLLRTLLASAFLAAYLALVRVIGGDFWMVGRTVRSFSLVALVGVGAAVVVVLALWTLNVEVVTVFLRRRIKLK